jgi:hypothetical protein
MDENKQRGLPSRIEQVGMRPSGIVGGGEAFSRDSQPPRNPGRPKGSRNKMGSDLMTLVMQAADDLGFLEKDDNGKLVGTGKEGALGYLKWIGINRPERFVALMARVAPKQVFADVTHRSAKTTAEIEAELRDRGLPLDLMDYLLKVPEELDPDEDPDPYGLMKDVTPPASTNGTGTNGAGTGNGAG